MMMLNRSFEYAGIIVGENINESEENEGEIKV